MKKIDDSIYYNISRVALLLRRDFLHTLKEFNITPEQWSVMALLREQDKPLSQKIIVDHLLKDKHTISKMINRMENKNWIIKKQDKSDNRITLISLSKKGHEDLEKIKDILKKTQGDRSYSNTTNDEKDVVLNFLKQIRIYFKDLEE